MKKDNKGFSLVELIIVIAIMAILVGIVGSQVLPYLNKSREAKDQQILSGWVTAALSAYSANAAALTDTSYTLTIGATSGQVNAVSVTGTTNPSTLQQAFSELSGVPTTGTSGTKFASKLYQDITSVSLLITPTDSTYVVRINSIGWNASGTSAKTLNTSELVAK